MCSARPLSQLLLSQHLSVEFSFCIRCSDPFQAQGEWMKVLCSLYTSEDCNGGFIDFLESGEDPFGLRGNEIARSYQCEMRK